MQNSNGSPNLGAGSELPDPKTEMLDLGCG